MTPDSTRRLRVGILGAGMITTVDYGFLPGIAHMADRAEVVAIASRTRSLAEQVARDWSIPEVHDDLTSMLADSDIDVVINATPIPAHFETNLEILSAGKHLVTDKPMAMTVADATALIDTAAAHDVHIVSAPGEMLTPDWSEARRLVREGVLGKVAFARVQSSHAGPAAFGWPVDPTPYYRKGQGSLLEMGVYGLDRVTGILGPAQRVSAFSGLVAPERVVRGGPFDGRRITADEDDNTLVMLDFGDATFAVVDGCFTVAATKSAPMEVYGMDGTLLVQRPDSGASFATDLSLEIFRMDAAGGIPGWIRPQPVGIPPSVRPWQLRRAILLDHLADVLDGAPMRLGPERARHVLEIMLAAKVAAAEGRVVELTTTFSEPD
jgi:predicted dehydrogenase